MTTARSVYRLPFTPVRRNESGASGVNPLGGSVRKPGASVAASDANLSGRSAHGAVTPLQAAAAAKRLRS